MSTTEEECSLNCLNGGSCAFSTSGSMVCKCPSRFSGVQCEIAFERCGQNQHPCYNGATCVHATDLDTSVDIYYCDCASTPSSDQAYAGHLCQHASTVFCAADQEEKLPKHTFCTNGGHCKQIVNPDEAHQGCICPKEWTGEHCQYRSRNYDVNATAERRMHTIEWVLYAIVLGVTLFLAGCVVQSLLERRRERNKVRLEEKARSQNLAAGALHDVDLAFNPYDCDNDQAATQRQPLRLW